MVAIASFLIALMQTLAEAQTVCTADVETPDNVLKVCLLNEDGKTVLTLSRYLGSGEVEEERIPFSSLKMSQETQGQLATSAIPTSFIAKSLEDYEVINAKNFVKTPPTITN